MHELVAWCGFFGAWALVAGPVYQAFLELSEEEFQREKLEQLRVAMTPPEPVSAWWWIVPPLHVVLTRRRTEAYKREVLSTLSDQDFADLMRYMNKAGAWMVVAAGGVLIATKETFELLEHHEWPEPLLFVLVPLMFLLCVGYTVGQARRDRRAHLDRTASREAAGPDA